MKTLSTLAHLWRGRSSRLLPALLALLLIAGFSTSSMAQNLLTEGFENSTYPPTGWTRTQSNASYPWIRVTSFSTSPYLYPSIAAHTGSWMIDFQSFTAGSGTTADIATPVLNFTSTNLVQVSFWMYRDPGYPNYNTEKVDVYVNTSASVTGGTLLGSVIRWSGGTTTLAGPVASAGWYKYTVNVPSSFNTATNYIIFRATSQFGNDQFLDDIKVDNIGPCTGTPLTATVSPSGTQTVCPGTTATLTASNVTVAANLNFQWWQSTNGGVTWTPVVGGSGANTDIYTTGAITSNIRYRFHQICLNTGDSSVSPVVIFNVTSGPTYATLPFFEGFENWTSRCGTSDIPSVNWTNIAFTGNNSWRRDDQGSTAAWTTPTGGVITPVFKDGAHSARFHAYYANSGDKNQAGALSVYLDCSAVPGNKELQFYSHRDPNASYPQDSLIVDTSTNGGATFGVLAKFGAGSAVWDFHTITFPSNSATTVIRFRAWQNYNCTGCGYPDIFLDGVKVLPPCAGKPTAGTINPVNPCPGQNFTLSLTGTSSTAGLGYIWQFRPAGATGPWTNLAGGTVPRPTANISVPTYFRAIVNCTNGGPTDVDTSAPLLANLASFYYCYCGTSVTYPQYPYVTISNIKIQTQPANVVLLNNGNPLPLLNNPNIPVNGYTDYRYTVPAPTLIRDSTYKMTVSEADAYTSSWYAGYTSVWIDYDRDGIFGNPGERILTNTPVLNATTGNLSFNFTVPSNTGIGLTGMRITMGMYTNTNPSPCGLINTYGEAEDYLVYLEYPPCTGPVNAGSAWISDTAVCPGYSVDLGDTSYEKQRTNISRVWQFTNNGGAVWFNIPGSVNKDTINNVTVTGASMYRLAAICMKTGDTSYSNVMNVSIPAPVRCYPYATAIGNPSKDSTDIGAFAIGTFINPGSSSPAGPHLNNPLATRRRTDYTLMPGIELYADTTYRLAIFQTMSRNNHSDALVSVFMDFNNDLQYNITTPGLPFTSELVFQGVTHWDSFYLDTKITIPDAVIPNVPTGMRVVINNDLNPGNPGNTGVGAFTSGEVEDYVVVFRRASLGIGGTGNVLKSLAMYPNPTEGKFTVLCDAGRNVSQMEVVVSTITGQQVITRSYDNVGTHFTTELDLGTAAKGIYFVEVRADGDKITRKLIVR